MQTQKVPNILTTRAQTERAEAQREAAVARLTDEARARIEAAERDFDNRLLYGAVG